jgi:hypothetical protein
MSEDRMKILEERLTRLEAALAQRAGGTGAGITTGTGGFTLPPGTVSDPPPFPTGGWMFFPRPVPSPVVDPAPWPYPGGWGRPRWPIVDPAPFPPGVVVDPAPMPQTFDPAIFQSAVTAALGRIGKVADPPPPDVSRLSAVQLESALHSIAAERARLDSMEQLVKKQLETAKKQQP